MQQLQPFEDVCFTGFPQETIEKIKRDCLRFATFTLPSGLNIHHIKDETTTYIIHKTRDGIDLQATPINKDPNVSYEYGIHIFKEDNITKFWVYHNPHGPYSC
jgi:hypothetical protein